MSDGTTAPVEGAKKKRPKELAVEQVFQTAEQAAAAVPAGSKKLVVWTMKCPKGEAFVVAPSEVTALVVFAKIALTVTAESAKKRKKSEKTPNVKKRLSDLIAQGENATTPEAKALVEQMKSIQNELAAARERRAAKKAAEAPPTTPPSVPA